MKITANNTGYNIQLSDEDLEILMDELKVSPAKQTGFKLFSKAAKIKAKFSKVGEAKLIESSQDELRALIRLIKKDEA